MTPAEYQTEALKTWTAPLRESPDGRDYLRLGLVSEIGEVAGVLKRIIRDGWPMDVWRPKLVAELGDVAWYAAVAAHENEDWSEGFTTDRIMQHFSDHEMEWRVAANMAVAKITWPEVFAANIAKLRDRQARGVISGEGDNR